MAAPITAYLPSEKALKVVSGPGVKSDLAFCLGSDHLQRYRSLFAPNFRLMEKKFWTDVLSNLIINRHGGTIHQLTSLYLMAEAIKFLLE